MIIKTRYKKSLYGGNMADTLLHSQKGQSYEITTMKRHTGRYTSTLSKVEISDNAITQNWDGTIGHIAHDIKRGTVKAVKAAHLEAIHNFMEQLKWQSRGSSR